MSPKVSLFLIDLGLWNLPIPTYLMVKHIISGGGSWWWWLPCIGCGFAFSALLELYVRESYRHAVLYNEEA